MSDPCTVASCDCASFDAHLWMPKKCVNCSHVNSHRMEAQNTKSSPPPLPTTPVPLLPVDFSKSPQITNPNNVNASAEVVKPQSGWKKGKVGPPIPPRRSSLEFKTGSQATRARSATFDSQGSTESARASMSSSYGRSPMKVGNPSSVMHMGESCESYVSHHSSSQLPVYLAVEEEEDDDEEEEEEEYGDEDDSKSLLSNNLSSHEMQVTMDMIEKEVDDIRASTRRMSYQGSEDCFSHNLIHKYPFVNAQVHAGLFSVKRVRGFFKKICHIEERFAREMKKAVEIERKKLDQTEARGYEPDRMATSWRTWVGLLDSMSKVASQHEIFSQQISNNIFKPLDVFYSIDRERVLEIHSTLLKNGKVMDKNARAIEKEKAKCQATIKNFIQKREEAIRDGKESTISNAKKLRIKALNLASTYDMMQKQSSHRREAFYTRELPHALDEMQILEELRLRTMKKYMQKFASEQKQIIDMYQELHQNMNSLLDELDPNDDIHYFIQHCNSLHGLPPEYQPYVYDLDMSLTDLQVENFENQHTVAFSGTLQHMMDLQKKLDPTNDYGGVPRVLFTLLKAIECLGGLQTEGIFRVSPSQREVQELRQQFCEGDYEIRTASPHVPAALLKFWLRDLKEPLIPSTLYQLCIEIGTKYISPHEYRMGNAAASGPSSSSRPIDDSLLLHLQGVIDQVPLINRAVMHHLLVFLRQVTRYEEMNRMSASNLAIVFAPSFLRDEHNDPMVMLQNTKFAAQFVCHLIRNDTLNILGDQPIVRSDSVSVSGIRIVSLKEAQAMLRTSSQDDLFMENQSAQTWNTSSIATDRNDSSAYEDYGYNNHTADSRSELQQHRYGNRAQTRAIELPGSVNRGGQKGRGEFDNIYTASSHSQSSSRHRSQTYIPPTELPVNWVEYHDEHGTPYYVNILTRVSQWEHPSSH